MRPFCRNDQKVFVTAAHGLSYRVPAPHQVAGVHEEIVEVEDGGVPLATVIRFDHVVKRAGHRPDKMRSNMADQRAPRAVDRLKQVKIGAIRGSLRVIRSGLTPNDWVIIDGIPYARPGSKVAPQERAIRYAAAQGHD